MLRILAFPFSLIYALVVHFRNFLYDNGIFASKSFETSTICVGNLSVGGTGKTPMIEYLIRLLEGRNVAILSRGYKRKSKGFVLANADSKVEELGDEPFQIHKKFPNAIVAVDAERRNGIGQLKSIVKPDVILLDDAYQHRKVKPKFSILLTAYGKLYINDWYLPTGNLRDSKSEAKRANIIIVTKCPENISEAERSSIVKKLKPLPHQYVLFSMLKYQKNVQGADHKTLPLESLQGKKVALVTGIASPDPLLQHLKSKEVDFTHFGYADHHDFSAKEIQEFSGFEIVLTTEKDYVRLEGKLNKLYYLEVAHSFSEEDAKFLGQSIKKLI
ncbi:MULTISPECIES: tetraacyldisaccharide 4'-kinase [Flavobacteriaceae]|uniref:tetraacyldisaccharide 4'-kinase n=1 Tax=Flavobacteriaceae TaxID=49546 RepID=UPI0028BD3D4A|nr:MULTISPECIES: tetraacyldisaccharide 4'-kinase [Allomuricauda]